MLLKQDIDFYSSTTLKSYNLDKTMRYQLDMLGNLDLFTRRHSENVANLTCRMCEYLHAGKSFTIHTTICAYLHDIGKITPLFQSQILKSLPTRRSIFEHYGIDNISENFIDKEKSHHTKCGEAILLDLGFPKGFSSIVGAHHGMPAENLLHHIEKYSPHFFGKPVNCEFWKRLYKEWAYFSLEQAGFSSISEIPVLGKRTEILLSGLLIMADWIASNQANFELLDEIGRAHV